MKFANSVADIFIIKHTQFGQDAFGFDILYVYLCYRFRWIKLVISIVHCLSLQFFRGHSVDSLLWGSMFGYPSDSLASCGFPVGHCVFSIILWPSGIIIPTLSSVENGISTSPCLLIYEIFWCGAFNDRWNTFLMLNLVLKIARAENAKPKLGHVDSED